MFSTVVILETLRTFSLQLRALSVNIQKMIHITDTRHGMSRPNCKKQALNPKELGNYLFNGNKHKLFDEVNQATGTQKA